MGSEARTKAAEDWGQTRMGGKEAGTRADVHGLVWCWLAVKIFMRLEEHLADHYQVAKKKLA